MVRKVDVKTASRQLGLTTDAIRKRIERGTIKADKDKSGRLLVHLPDDVQDSDETMSGQVRTDVDVVSVLREHIETLKVENARQQKTIDAYQKTQEQTNYILAMKEQKILELEAPKENYTFWERLFGKK